MLVLGVTPEWAVMYDLILRKSPGQCHIWHATKSSKCWPCLNFDAYTVYVRVACPDILHVHAIYMYIISQ